MSAGLPARIQRFSPPSRFRSGMHYAWRKAVPYGSVTAQVLHLFPYYLPLREAPTAPLIMEVLIESGAQIAPQIFRQIA